MKAILVIDMPQSCGDCPLFEYSDICMYCAANDIMANENYRLKDCPLKPMPNKKVPDGNETDEIYGCYVGWNACVDEILGEEE